MTVAMVTPDIHATKNSSTEDSEFYFEKCEVVQTETERSCEWSASLTGERSCDGQRHSQVKGHVTVSVTHSRCQRSCGRQCHSLTGERSCDVSVTHSQVKGHVTSVSLTHR
ncbi:hypothetical protein JOB18_022323 [Solea senegalensis]|uniref:Uncharacterized protein n=1 Tax=Solea senegalensis TaxID=28829 RepID=A0AAV6PFL9_SOLSE|nr:hypothetical protein JOB18_022323 [Solea senegalensis]